MSEEKEKRKKEEDVEELKEVLGVVSKEVPSLIKGIIGSVFSEEAGRDMGKAAAAFYKELKDAGIPEETAVKMTENYVSVFTSLGDVMKKAVSGKREIKGEEIGEEISKKIKEKLAEKHREEDEEEEEEDENED
jgi:DNA gyrase/topoisomerase IV subunit A